MILHNKGSLAHGYFFLLVIDRAVLVAEAELVTMSFEEDIHAKVVGKHRVFESVEIGVLYSKVGLNACGEFFTFAKEIPS